MRSPVQWLRSGTEGEAPRRPARRAVAAARARSGFGVRRAPRRGTGRAGGREPGTGRTARRPRRAPDARRGRQAGTGESRHSFSERARCRARERGATRLTLHESTIS
jgi:hypothetical protein